MKHTPLITFIMLFFLISGCKKDTLPAVTAKSLVGHWFSMFNYQWYGEVILNEDGTGEIIHYPPYASDTSRTPIEWTSTDSAFCWSFLGSTDKCMSYYKIKYYSADSIVMHQNTSSGWYAQLTKKNNYRSVITKPYISCISPYYFDTTKYTISTGFLDPSSTYYLKNNQVIIQQGNYSWESYDINFNYISRPLFEVSFVADTSYNVKSINNNNSFTGQFFVYSDYNKRGGYIVNNNLRRIITIPNSDYCSAELINDNNIVAGKVQYGSIEKLFFYNNGAIDTFSIPYTHDFIKLIDINNNFVLASYGNNTDHTEHYFKLYLNKSIIPLNYNENYHFSATNNNGQIAGTLNIPLISCDVYPFIQRDITMGIILEHTGSLTYYCIPNSNSNIRDINDNGDLFGFQYNDYTPPAFVLKRR
ncbi:MAG: hypothetical protein U0T77_08200 [Chitinophagales bacterium]